MPSRFLERTFGHAMAFAERTRKFGWIDALILVGLAGLFHAGFHVAEQWAEPLRPTVSIDLSPRALPMYAMFSLTRGLFAYVLSLAFTLLYGYWAAKDARAEKLLLPLLDILQSIPVLGFMPGLVLGLVALVPRSNLGLELASVVMMFTGQVWNMTFSFYHSLRAVPRDLAEVGEIYRFDAWQRLRWVELPSATLGLVWNSMMSMAGGWFFLMITESFQLGSRDFRLPGLGSYMSVAVAHGDVPAMIRGVVTMIAMITALDQLLWRPVVAWAQKFRAEETGTTDVAHSWFLDWLRHSGLVRRAFAGFARLARAWSRRRRAGAVRVSPPEPRSGRASPAPARALSTAFFVLLLGLLAWGAWRLFLLLHELPAARWLDLGSDALITLLRVLASTALGTLWALPAGLAIGLSPRLSRLLQPVVQAAASFPAPMLFPAAIAFMRVLGMPLNFGSVLLMLLGTQWYILFNVIAGAMAIPGDLREAAASYRVGWLDRARILYVPCVFPHLVTGWVTAAGGAWNASIVSEYVSFEGRSYAAHGIGSQISVAAERGEFPQLAAGVLVMSALVVTFNRTVWRRCYQLATERFTLNR